MRAKITKDHVVRCNEEGTVTRLYRAGEEGTFPHDHVEQIVAAKAGHAIEPSAAKADEPAKVKK